jgi:hypothetical protein
MVKPTIVSAIIYAAMYPRVYFLLAVVVLCIVYGFMVFMLDAWEARINVDD